MKAIICTRYGGPEVLKVKDIDKPRPDEKEVLIRIKASAVTASDTYIRKLETPGKAKFHRNLMIGYGMRVMLGFFRPRSKIVGLVLSGEVVEVGSKVTKYQVGDEIFGMTDTSFGAYAEYKCISEEVLQTSSYFYKPSNICHEEAAATTYGGILTVYFMKPSDIQPEQKILIYGASGATGTMAIQIAKARGAEVTAVCSQKNFELVKSLGTDHVIDYRLEGAEKKLGRYDLVFDAVGAKRVSKLKTAARTALTDSGKYVSVDHALMSPTFVHVKELVEYIQDNKVKAVIDKSYPMSEIVRAHSYVDKGHKIGNVTIIV